MFIDKAIEALCSHIGETDFARRERLRHGIYLLTRHIQDMRPPNSVRDSMMFRYVIPTFARLIYLSHRLDVPIERYAGELFAFMEVMLVMDDQGLPHIEARFTTKNDPEADMLEFLAGQFARHSGRVFDIIDND